MVNKPHKVTIWEMFRDIFVNATNKGQLPATILGLLFVIYFIRMPVEDLKQLGSNVVEYLKSGYLLGYFLFIITVLGWFYHAKRLRRTATKEQERIGNEKTTLQKKHLPGKIKSSMSKR